MALTDSDSTEQQCRSRIQVNCQEPKLTVIWSASFAQHVMYWVQSIGCNDCTRAPASVSEKIPHVAVHNDQQAFFRTHHDQWPCHTTMHGHIM